MAPTAIITGGARRIGQVISQTLAKAGWDIAVHYHSSRNQAKDLAKHIRQEGRKCETFQADLGDTEQLSKLIERVCEEMGGCNLLVNNASIFTGRSFLETEPACLAGNFAINLQAPLLLSQVFARTVESGQIVNIIDARIERTVTDHFAYTLSKNALWELTKMSAKALAPNIRVNAVCPGLILPSEGGDDSVFDSIIPKIPLKRQGKLQEVADAVRFLTESEFITGQAIFVDGGEHLR